MNVLWICNILFPEAERLLTGNGDLKATGGWMLGLADSLMRCDGVNLAVASLSPIVDDVKCIHGEKITYYVLPYGKGNLRYNKDYEKYWIQLNKAYGPDVVHIHGTEFTHGLAYVKACGAKNVVVSIQGLVSVYSNYYNVGLSPIDIIKSVTLRDLLKGTLFHDKNEFRHRGSYEIEMLQLVNHVIGRTSWDRAHIWAINPKARYHFCNETLRTEFYNGEVWKYEKCIPHTIFLSQAGYPVKGLHQLLKAISLILRHYPDTTVKIAGLDITKKRYFKDVIPFISGYGLLIKRMIKSLGLENHVSFTGNLNAEEMKEEYLRCNVFVCPSAIENSPNSLGEAQILGIPIVASYVGGIPDMMCGDEEHLYRFEEIEMLAYKVCKIFANQGKQVDMREIANKRHDGEQNMKTTLEIYRTILGKK